VWLGTLGHGFFVTISEVLNPDCNESWLPQWVVDVRDPQHPIPIAQLPRPKAPDDAPYEDFCFARGRFGSHVPPALSAPGRPSQSLLPLSYFNAGIRCFDLSNPANPREVAYFVAPHGGTLSPECAASPHTGQGEAFEGCMREGRTYHRPADTVFVEWDRNLIYAGTTTGLYILSTPALGRPVLGARPVTEWSLPGVDLPAASRT
jgi:hypothetical protein